MQRQSRSVVARLIQVVHLKAASLIKRGLPFLLAAFSHWALASQSGAQTQLPVTTTGKSAPVSASTNWCQRLVTRLPKISVDDCLQLPLQAGGAASVKQFPLLQMDISATAQPANPQRANPLKILLIGGIHGDEQTASSAVFKWVAALQKNKQQEFNWRVFPVLNPDGLLAPKPSRTNARGVDLNRNFPTPNWLQEAPSYWQRATGSDPRRFPGKAPISEPESKVIFDTIESFRPDVIISVHAPFGVLDLDGPARPPRRFGRLWYNRVGVYPGSLGNYSGLHKRIPVVTIELPHATQLPPDAEIARIGQDMQSWIRRNVRPQAENVTKTAK